MPSTANQRWGKENNYYFENNMYKVMCGEKDIYLRKKKTNKQRKKKFNNKFKGFLCCVPFN